MNLLRKTVCFLCAEHFQVYSWKGGKLSEAHYFPNDSSGREELSTFLAKYREPAHMLVDIIEEDFHHETVPHLFGANRHELIGRKFELYYRNTIFRQAKTLYRQLDGRRDDVMLFSALTNPQHISPWLDTLLTHHIPLIGIYSLPNISTPLLKDINADHILLLSWEKHAGLRQTYFNKKSLHFSRLTPVNNSSSFSEAVAAETPRTQQYLKSLSLPPPGDILQVCIICHANDRLLLESKLGDTLDLRYLYLDIQTLGKRIKSKDTYENSDATRLFLHLLAAHPPTNNYANSTHQHFYMLWQVRWILYGLALVIFLISLLWSGISVWQGQQFESETTPLLTQAARINQESEKVKSQFPITTIPANDIKTAVIAMRKLSNYSPTAEEILSELSKVMELFPRIRIDKLEWQVNPTDSSPSIYPAQDIVLKGELLDFGTEFRASLGYLDDFQKSLTEHGYTAMADSLPLDISPNGRINSDLQTQTEKSGQFSLKLIWRNQE